MHSRGWTSWLNLSEYNRFAFTEQCRVRGIYLDLPNNKQCLHGSPLPHLGCIGRLYSAWPESPTVEMTFAKIGKCDLFFLMQVVFQKQKDTVSITQVSGSIQGRELKVPLSP